MRELLLLDEYAKQSKAIKRFMLVLSTLYTLDAAGFAAATDALHGRTRIYFSPASSLPWWLTVGILSRNTFQAPLIG